MTTPKTRCENYLRTQNRSRCRRVARTVAVDLVKRDPRTGLYVRTKVCLQCAVAMAACGFTFEDL